MAGRFAVRSLALFGSVARDEARADSDVDVVVEFAGPTTFDRHMVAAGDPVSRYVDGVTFGAFEVNDEKRAAVERQLFILGEAAARLPDA